MDKTVVIKTITKAAAPMMVRRIIRDAVVGKPTLKVYEWLRNTTIWDGLPQKHKDYMLGYKPWDLDWLTIQWVVSVLEKFNKPVAYLVATSPELKGKIEENISIIKKQLS